MQALASRFSGRAPLVMGRTGRVRTKTGSSATAPHGGVTHLESLRRTIDRQPGIAVVAFSIAWLIWTLSYTGALSIYPDSNFAVHLAPHVGFLSVVLGLILFPPRFSWFPMVLFTGLSLITLISPYMLALDTGAGRGLYYGGIAFTVNLGMALFFGRLGAKIANGYNPPFRMGLSQTGMLLVVVFAACVATAFVNFALVDGGMNVVFGQSGAEPQEDRIVKGWYVLFRGVYGGFAGMLMLTLCLAPISRHDIRRALLVSPVFVLASWASLQGALAYPELVFSVVLLAFALLSSSVAVALLGIIGSVIFVMSTGTFIVTSMDVTDAELLAQGMSIALVALTALIMVQKFETAQTRSNNARRMALRETAQTRAGIGRFQIDVQAGLLLLDDTAQTAMELPARSSFTELENLLDDQSLDALFALTFNTGETLRHAQIKVPYGDCDGGCDTRLVGWIDDAPDANATQIVHGYVTRVPGSASERSHTGMRGGVALSKRDKNAALILKLSARLEATVDDLATSLETMSDRRDDTQNLIEDARGRLINRLNSLRLILEPNDSAPDGTVPMRPSDFLKQVKEDYTGILSARDFSITVLPVSGPDQPELLDQHRLSHVIGEMVRNSALHSGGSGVWLSHSQETDWKNQNWSVWTVEDDGRGLDNEMISDAHQLASHTACGLGICTCQTAVEALGGTLRYLPGIRGGARLEIRLPLYQAESISSTADYQTRMASVHWGVMTRSPQEGTRLTGMLAHIAQEVSFYERPLSEHAIPETNRPDVILYDLDTIATDVIWEDLRTARKIWPRIGIVGMTAQDKSALPKYPVDLILPRSIEEKQLRFVLDHLAGQKATPI